MVAPSSAGFRRLLPLLKPYKRELLAAFACCLWPHGPVGRPGWSVDPSDRGWRFPRVLRVIAVALSLFLLQSWPNLVDTLLADPALQ